MSRNTSTLAQPCPDHLGSNKVGFAAPAPQDSAAEPIERADADLPNRRAEPSARRRSCSWREHVGLTHCVPDWRQSRGRRERCAG
jgi:hypothetical protein